MQTNGTNQRGMRELTEEEMEKVTGGISSANNGWGGGPDGTNAGSDNGKGFPQLSGFKGTTVWSSANLKLSNIR